MAIELLRDVQVRNAKPKSKAYRLHDGEGLYLWVSTTGAKAWQFRYKRDRKAQTTTFGKYPRISLAEARAKAADARTRAENGEHLTVVKRLSKLQKCMELANTFESYSAAWITREARRMGWSPDYRTEVEASLKNHLKDLNALPMTQIVAPIVAPLLMALENKAPHMVEKVRRRLRAILDYAVEQGVIAGNPLPAVHRGAKVARRHFPAVTDLMGVGAILRAARTADPCRGIQRAHLLLAFTGQRVSEVVGARWDEFQLDGVSVAGGDGHRTKHDATAGNWLIPRERMKRKDAERGPHIVPLPPALLAELRAWRKADANASEFVCPAPRDSTRSITPEAVEKHYREALRLGGKHSPHSWRSAISTICRDAGKDADAVEAQLDHVVGNKIAAAYDRARRLELRRQLMTWYESKLDSSRDGADVVEITRTTRE